jgi:hypothetical protein
MSENTYQFDDGFKVTVRVGSDAGQTREPSPVGVDGYLVRIKPKDGEVEYPFSLRTLDGQLQLVYDGTLLHGMNENPFHGPRGLMDLPDGTNVYRETVVHDSYDYAADGESHEIYFHQVWGYQKFVTDYKNSCQIELVELCRDGKVYDVKTHKSGANGRPAQMSSL